MAIGFLFDKPYVDDGVQTLTPVLPLTVVAPHEGDRIVSFAYPNSTGELRKNGSEMVFNGDAMEGHFEEAHPNGRDRVILTGPCYRTSMPLAAGPSGGPVVFGNARYSHLIRSYEVEFFSGDELNPLELGYWYCGCSGCRIKDVTRGLVVGTREDRESRRWVSRVFVRAYYRSLLPVATSQYRWASKERHRNQPRLHPDTVLSRKRSA